MRLFGLARQIADLLLGLLPGALYVVLGLLLIFVELVLVHGDRSGIWPVPLVEKANQPR